MFEILPVPLILESGQSNYVNLLAARADNKDSPAMKSWLRHGGVKEVHSRAIHAQCGPGFLTPCPLRPSDSFDPYILKKP